MNGNGFIQHSGSLRVREWDGKFRRGQHRSSSSFSSKLIFRPRYPPASASASNPAPNLDSQISLLQNDVSDLPVSQNENISRVNLSIPDSPPSPAAGDNLRVDLDLRPDSPPSDPEADSSS